MQRGHKGVNWKTKYIFSIQCVCICVLLMGDVNCKIKQYFNVRLYIIGDP